MRQFSILLGVLALAACASAPEAVVDNEAVARAERSAQLGWAKIQWVNYPTTHKKAPAGSSNP
ncbi:hypothetical protein [Chitinimonas sp.]|uniref:hypothetical protein n=1 Tax=Chitinimonas sp. TaxID=1934313 RepID=UPI0035B3E207